MATSKFWQRISAPASSAPEWEGEARVDEARNLRGTPKLWMALDALTVLVSVTLATIYKLHVGPVLVAKDFWHGTLIHGRSTSSLFELVCGFTIALILTNRRLNLYHPVRLPNFLNEQWLSAQACFTSGLLLAGTLYVVHFVYIPRTIVLITVGLVTVLLSLRRGVYRFFMYRRFERGLGTRNILIVGTGPGAHALHHHLESIRHLGYAFKGFVDMPGSGSPLSDSSGEVAAALDTLFAQARKQFIDEIFFTAPCERGTIHQVLDQARAQGIDLRVVPDLYDGLAWDFPIEYIGKFPTIPLHRGHVPEIALVLKRTMDILFSSFVLIAFSPVLALIAIAIKLDSKGPVLYYSERIGKKGRVFRCAKFRTMVRDAENHRADVMHMNERDGVLFKISNDPRITKVGRFLRKYSLDELPQFINVLRGDMSVVGPRPPLASEVREYKLNHLRRLDVTPGVTGLWQVQGRQDPSFDSYISLDVTYIENWSIWLDIKIVLRTIAVVLAGTGS